MSRADTTRRVDRLAGNGQDDSGGGLQLPLLFATVLDAIQDRGPQPASALVQPVADAIRKPERVSYIYRKQDAYPELVKDTLEQLAYAGMLAEQDGRWALGESFQTGKRLEIIKARRGKHPSIGVTVYPAEVREARGKAELHRMEITSLAARLKRNGPGLRPVDPKHVKDLAESMRAFGYMDRYPILVDQDDRIIDGRHRRDAARLADVPALETRIEGISDMEALRRAVVSNVSRGWLPRELREIAQLLQAEGVDLGPLAGIGGVIGREGMRTLIRAALLEDPTRTDRSIADRAGCSHVTVAKVREEMQANGQIVHSSRVTDAGKPAPGPKPKASEEEKDQALGASPVIPAREQAEPEPEPETEREAPSKLDPEPAYTCPLCGSEVTA